MIVLDTNVVSACMRPQQNRAVIDWLNDLPAESIWTTTVTVFELRYGMEKLGAEHRKRLDLEASWLEFGSMVFQNRILQFDLSSAQAAAELAGTRALKERFVDMRDTFIAGIVISRKATLATRNTRDFADAGIKLIDPWIAGKRKA